MSFKSTTSKYPSISDDPEVQAHYEMMRRKGETHNMAIICSTGRAPAAIGMPGTVFRGKTINEQLGPSSRDALKRKAAAAGITLTGNEHYCSAIAREPLDLKAIVSTGADGVHAIKARAKKLGRDLDGMITAKNPAPTYEETRWEKERERKRKAFERRAEAADRRGRRKQGKTLVTA